MITIGGAVLAALVGVTFLGVQFSPVLKAQKWWPWKSNRKVAG